jgi:hypothetical protein
MLIFPENQQQIFGFDSAVSFIDGVFRLLAKQLINLSLNLESLVIIDPVIPVFYRTPGADDHAFVRAVDSLQGLP